MKKSFFLIFFWVDAFAWFQGNYELECSEMLHIDRISNRSFFLSQCFYQGWSRFWIFCIVLYCIFWQLLPNLKKTDGLVTERLVCARIKEFLIAFEDFFSSWSIKTLSLSALKFNKINKFSIDFMEKNIFVPPCVNEIYFRTPKSFPPPVKSVHLPTKFLSWYKS